MERGFGSRWTRALTQDNQVMESPLSPQAARRLLLTMVFVSGMSGLIYQVVWHRYLAILLGAQARATSLVLAIFLGGISLGYVTFGRWSRWKPWNLFFVYAMVELGLGVWAYLFPLGFDALFPLSHKLYSAFGVQSLFVDVFLTVLLIGFPTFLMGGTLPLLTQAMAQDLTEASGTHAKIYGWNTVGACFGCLLAGYVFIPALGLSVTGILAGTLNCFIALLSYFLLAKSSAPNRPDSPSLEVAGGQPLNTHTAILLLIGFFSGFYILCLETVLIRLVGLSTGAAEYNFTLIVSIFVFGLGLGSLVVRRIAKYTEAHLFWCQAAISVLLLGVYLSIYRWPYWAHLVRVVFRDIVQNFYLYQASLGMLFLLVLVVPVSFCGLVLPLCFHLLKDRKETLGYRVGQLYGLNTVGSVLGALLGGYFLLYFVDLDQLLKICIGITLVMLALGAYSYFTLRRPSLWVKGVGGAVVIGVGTALLLLEPHPKENYTQPFRQQAPISATWKGWKAFHSYLASAANILFYKDGPNSTISIASQISKGKEGSRTVFVNGKSDGNTRGDFHTMSLTGHLPAIFSRNLDRAAIVGFGTGITAGAFLSYDELKYLDVIEISETLIKTAHFFDQYNGGVSVNPRVRFHQMDAFRYFGGVTKTYDVIVSEPSNPWVAGVENLYSTEFYQIAKRRLVPGGIYVQWLQAYAFEDDLMKRVLATIRSNFASVNVFQMMSSDYLLVASDRPIEIEDLRNSAARFERSAGARELLKKSGILKFENLLAHEVISDPVVQVIASETEPLYLAEPVLSHEATKAFFVRNTVEINPFRRFFKEFYSSADASLFRKYLGPGIPTDDTIESLAYEFCSHPVGHNRERCAEVEVLMYLAEKGGRKLASSPQMLRESDKDGLLALTERKKFTGPFQTADLEAVGRDFALFKQVFSPVAYVSYGPMVERLDYCLSTVDSALELHGECLLQKAAILEVLDPRPENFLPVINQYNDWFASLPETSTNYSRFKTAKGLLDQITTGLATLEKSRL